MTGEAFACVLFGAVCVLAAIAAILPLAATLGLLLMRRDPKRSTFEGRIFLLRPVETFSAEWAASLDADLLDIGARVERLFLATKTDVGDRNDLVLCEPLPLANPKVSKLVFGFEQLARTRTLSPNDVVVHADADVRLDGLVLSSLVRSLPPFLEGGNPAAVFALPAPEGGTFLGELFARTVLLTTTQSFASVFSLERMLGRAPSIAGKLVALRVGSLNAIGGYKALLPSIADDIALSSAIASRDGTITLGPVARTVDPSRTFASQSAQFVRWLRVLRAHRPLLAWSYPVFTTPFALLFVLLPTYVLWARFVDAPVSPVVGKLVATALVARAIHGGALARGIFGAQRDLPLRIVFSPFIDLPLFALWVRAMKSRTIEWQGRIYSLESGGTIRAT